jgi:tRNA dimethylallyltransferase
MTEVLALFGPTASGKSAVAEALARRLGTEVVSADAMQVYRGVPILTNQPPVATRLVAIRDLTERMSLGEYAALAHAAIDELVVAHGVAVVAGGTGLYLRAALAELAVPPRPAPGARARAELLYDALGGEGAHARLAAIDAAAAAAVHPNDRRRVVRALELAESGSSLAPRESDLWSDRMRRPTLLVGIDVEVGALRRRIGERTRAMVARGALEEARAAATLASPTARHVIGLEELTTLELEDAEAAIARRTVRYAAAQRKWLRKLAPEVVLDGLADPDASAERVLALASAAAHPLRPTRDAPTL